ncbi:uncharacterized protein LOC117639910 [Thrips palmi]|uniref:Uncharacterized protein LOC117639910 n=1 Tax=Thrips palmi TaxID=161013 RepID=A0A6P8YDG1_THRPL|nr:uncharacterized protein LOC117639910 [Thrips palmi]XP_034231838.1 uncharacterized protein LOC117639910 [Thrips palmi]
MDQSLLLALPDDALLAVLAFLPPRELFKCRVLCRRLRDLCLHADLWRRVRLPTCDPTLRAALRLAPCLREVLWYYLGATAPWAEDEDPELSRSACVVARLKLYVNNMNELRASAAVLKQSSLGGVKELVLTFFPNYCGAATRWKTFQLVSAINQVNHLYSLQIKIFSKDALLEPWFAVVGMVGVSSLKKLSYASPSYDFYLEYLLKTHAATLEDVHLDLTHIPVSSLKLLLNLRTLSFETDSGDDLSELENLPNLSSLKFGLNCTFSTGGLKLLRRAPRLRSVSVPCADPDPTAPLLALAASPSALILETLHLDGLPSSSLLGHMAAALPQFPALRTLSMVISFQYKEVDLADFVRAVSPTTAPRLTMLALQLTPPEGVCPQAWIHGPSIRDLLQRNPSLHLRALLLPCYYVNCSWCLWDLRETRQAVLGAHARQAGCPPDCYRWL